MIIINKNKKNRKGFKVYNNSTFLVFYNSTFHKIPMHCGIPWAKSLLRIGLFQHTHKHLLKLASRYF